MTAATAPLSATRTVADVMTCCPLSLMPDERLDIARAIMVSCRLRHLPVATGDQLLGMISARDLAGLSNLAETPARAAMHFPVETVASTDSIAVAVGHLITRRFSSLAVVDGGALVGILTTTDSVALACEDLNGEPVSRLMTPGPLATVAPTELLPVARELMKADHVRHLPVVADHRLVGFLSDLDMLAADSGQTVADALPPRFASTSPEARAADAGRLLVRERLDALPVVRAGRLVGVLSAVDYLHYLIS